MVERDGGSIDKVIEAERIVAHYRHADHPEAYIGEFYPGPHTFDLARQDAVFAWL